jgi:hypothetical protein
VALWALGFVRVSVRARNRGCGKGSSLTITSNGKFEEHEAIMEQVIDILQKANFRANLGKCYFGEAKIDYLGYEITRGGTQPQPKKVEAILKLIPPRQKVN